MEKLENIAVLKSSHITSMGVNCIQRNLSLSSVFELISSLKVCELLHLFQHWTLEHLLLYMLQKIACYTAIVDLSAILSSVLWVDSLFAGYQAYCPYYLLAEVTNLHLWTCSWWARELSCLLGKYVRSLLMYTYAG